MLLLVPVRKGVQDRGIALLKVIYKFVSAIINKRMTDAIEFHQDVHGFRRHRGTATAIMEAKLRMQLAQRTKKNLFFGFLDLKKAYDTLDRGRTIKVLRGYVRCDSFSEYGIWTQWFPNKPDFLAKHSLLVDE
jgi:Reverse transcriptase (RNA-dependent DNA polymerase)